jgi:endonuclease YncB( thermonuclease family)
LALVAALVTAPAAPAVAQEEGRPAANTPSRKVIRTKRLRVPADLFERDAVFFKRVRVEAGGPIRADGHNLDLYGLELVRRNRICAPEGVRWACGQRAFIAMRGLLEGQSIRCSFIAAAGSPKAVCWVGDTDVTVAPQRGWAELAEGVTDESYVEAAASARRRKAGIWGDGPP